MIDEARKVYDGLCARFLSMEDTADNQHRFEVLLDLINFWEDNPDSSLEEYREYKDLVFVHGLSPWPVVRVVA